ncbi:MAG: hypothetical protein LBE02_04740 [Spirochaetaceae bacterium]|jgi:hypothetical protein|nr:hypothetical protein [Spirochaetaceae bacterium]
MKMMVKKYVVCAVVLCAALTVSGCVSIAREIARQISAGTIVYDQSLPAEQSVLVVFGDTIHVLEYNGIAVEEAWYPDGKYRINKVTLPAGETSILFNLRADVDQGNSITRISANDIEMRFTFEAEKEYTVGVYTKSQGFFKNTDYGVAIWGYAVLGGADANKIIKTWKLGEI